MFDAIVVGSGMSGGWAAKELCEKGLKTLVIERTPVYRGAGQAVQVDPRLSSRRPVVNVGAAILPAFANGF